MRTLHKPMDEYQRAPDPHTRGDVAVSDALFGLLCLREERGARRAVSRRGQGGACVPRGVLSRIKAWPRTSAPRRARGVRARFKGCFFFQAEDGIRDDLVTGVQTCALPI